MQCQWITGGSLLLAFPWSWFGLLLSSAMGGKAQPPPPHPLHGVGLLWPGPNMFRPNANRQSGFGGTTNPCIFFVVVVGGLRHLKWRKANALVSERVEVPQLWLFAWLSFTSVQKRPNVRSVAALLGAVRGQASVVGSDCFAM